MTIDEDEVDYGFDDADRPATDTNGGTYASDTDGRLTARPGQTLEWDELGRLVRVRRASDNAIIAQYTYDPLDRLATVTHPAAEEPTIGFRYVGLASSVAAFVEDVSGYELRLVFNDWTGTALFDREHEIETRPGLLPSASSPIASGSIVASGWTDGAFERHYGRNAHHDVTWLADSDGEVIATLRYDPWGSLIEASGSDRPPFRFQGSWFDAETGLSWVVTRWYAPSLGRFISEDGLLGVPASPPSRHLYAYATGDPVSRWDPDGHCPAAAAAIPWVGWAIAGAGCLITLAALLGIGVGGAVIVVAPYGVGREEPAPAAKSLTTPALTAAGLAVVYAWIRATKPFVIIGESTTRVGWWATFVPYVETFPDPPHERAR